MRSGTRLIPLNGQRLEALGVSTAQGTKNRLVGSAAAPRRSRGAALADADPGIAARLPGASAVVPLAGERYSSTTPLTAEITPSSGAVSVPVVDVLLSGANQSFSAIDKLPAAGRMACGRSEDARVEPRSVRPPHSSRGLYRDFGQRLHRILLFCLCRCQGCLGRLDALRGRGLRGASPWQACAAQAEVAAEAEELRRAVGPEGLGVGGASCSRGAVGPERGRGGLRRAVGVVDGVGVAGGVVSCVECEDAPVDSQ